MQSAVLGLSIDHRYKVAMAFEECNLVDAQRHEWREGVPLNTSRDPAVKDAEERVSGDILFGLYIGEGAIDQLHDQMAFVGLGVQRIWVIPIEPLRGCGMVIAEGAAEAFGSDAQIDDPTKNGQMPQQTRLVHPVAFGDGAPATPATRADKCAFDGEDELAGLGQLSLEDTDIRDVERYRDEWVLRHQEPSLRSRANYSAIVDHFGPRPNSFYSVPLHDALPTRLR